MPRVMMKNGVFVPLEPLPPRWAEGQEFVVDEAPGAGGDQGDDLDAWYRELEDAVKRIPPGDPDRLAAALREADASAKDQVRREMGLP